MVLAKIKGWICQNSKNVKVIKIDTNPSIEHQIAEIEANGTIERDYSQTAYLAGSSSWEKGKKHKNLLSHQTYSIRWYFETWKR